VISWNRANFGSSTRGSNFGKEVNVCLVILAPFARKVVFVIDRFYWTNRLTGSAVNTLIWVNVKHAVALIYAIHRALIDARLVLHIHTGKSNYVCQVVTSESMLPWQAYLL
jgi:hypothetical protein